MTRKRSARGTGTVREWKGRWQARYSWVGHDGQRRYKSRLFDTKTEARAWLTEELAQVRKGQVADAGNVTLGEYLEGWIKALELSELEAATISWYRSATQRHIIPALGHIRLDRLTPTHIEAFLADKAANGRLDGKGGLGAASVRRLTVTLHKALEAAVRKQLLRMNPVALADRPAAVKSGAPADVTERVWTPEQIAAFIDASRTDRLGAIFRLAAMTGLRRSEVCGLQWRDVDLESGTLSVKRARVVVDGHTVTKAPKTATSRRTVDLDAGTVTALREWRKAQLEERLRAGEAWEPGEWVASDQLGRPTNPEYLSRRFAEIAASAGLPPITLKQLRHSHATALLKAGVAPKVVQERLGHHSIQVTMDIYASVLPGMQRQAIDQLAQFIEA